MNADMNADTNRDTHGPGRWGWNRTLHTAYQCLLEDGDAEPEWRPARVVGVRHHRCELVCPDFSGRQDCDGAGPEGPESGASRRAEERLSGVRVSGRFSHRADRPSDFPAVGDWVLIDYGKSEPRIQAVIPRTSVIHRAAAGNETLEHVIAANLTVVAVVFGLDGGRNFLVRLLERALTVVWNSGAVPIVVLNKADRADPETRLQAEAEARSAAFGADVYTVGALTGEGIAELAERIGPGDTLGMLGKSGVGKSAIVNALERLFAPGGEGVREPAAAEGGLRRSDLQGRHTTTSGSLYEFAPARMIIDVPGLRELKLWGDGEDLDDAFPDIAELAQRCRFRDCRHEGEPGCAVQTALGSGKLDFARFSSYLDLQRELDFLQRKQDQRGRIDEKARWKAISKFAKSFKKPGRD